MADGGGFAPCGHGIPILRLPASKTGRVGIPCLYHERDVPQHCVYDIGGQPFQAILTPFLGTELALRLPLLLLLHSQLRRRFR